MFSPRNLVIKLKEDNQKHLDEVSEWKTLDELSR